MLSPPDAFRISQGMTNIATLSGTLSRRDEAR